MPLDMSESPACFFPSRNPAQRESVGAIHLNRQYSNRFTLDPLCQPICLAQDEGVVHQYQRL